MKEGAGHEETCGQSIQGKGVIGAKAERAWLARKVGCSGGLGVTNKQWGWSMHEGHISGTVFLKPPVVEDNFYSQYFHKIQ